MCQLTLLHGRSDVVKIMLPNLTLHNSLMNNKDGHGFFIVPKMIWRTIEEGNDVVFKDDYMKRLETHIGDDKETTIISHVRAASFKFKDLVNIDNTHPFQVDNIILMHNGTLATEDDSLEIEDQIDSLWFTKHLADIVKSKKLTPKHIAKAMEEFTGKFAFLIVDMLQPTKIFVVRGDTADLFYTTIKDGRGKTLVTAINTTKPNLEYSYVPMYWRALKGTQLVIQKPELLDDESIYIFDTKTSVLTKTNVEIKERTTVTSVQTVYPHIPGESHEYFNRGIHSDYVSRDTVDEMIDKIGSLAYTMSLDFTEVNLIFQILFQTSILFAEKDHIEAFLDTMKIISTEYGNRVGKKLKKWRIIKNAYSWEFPEGNALDIYDRTGIAFPWFLQSGSGIKSVSSRIKGGNFNWAKDS